MLNFIAANETAAVLEVIKDPSNKVLECNFYTEHSLYFSIKGIPDISFFLVIPVGYPYERLEICQISNGTTVGVAKKSIFNITDTVLMIMMTVCIEFKKPIPSLALKLNFDLYLKWMFDLINFGALKSQ
ncbi:unnamed protein product [Hymenolepis diminuta]|uniref:Uncharacterized protein n=1 Tax=Hymenolepis diminuta TaxID=6216 RepID=A0A564XWB6_HYMDI|nr:unnamed protein product [Hymenolepis diminuta]